MSGRGRKKPNRAAARRSQPTSKAGSASSRAKSGPTPPRQAAGSRSGEVPSWEQTQPVPAGPPRRPPSSGSSRPPNRSSRETRYARAARRKRNQRIGVLIGALALATALIGSRLAFQNAPTNASAQNAPRTSATATTTSSAAPTTTTTATPSASATPVTPMVITCPTGGGATAVFGHEIVVPEPYQVTITYGDGDKYTNDSAHLGAVFSHTYKKAGTYAVTAVLTAPSGGTATANCSYTWGP